MTEEIEVPQEIVEVPQEPTPEEIEAQQELQEQAKRYGWRPKDEFDLEPDGWVDADRFLEFPQTQAKMARDEVRELRTIVESKEEEILRVQQGAVESARKIDGLVQQGVQRELDRISQKQLEAVENADTETFQKLEKEKTDIAKRQPASNVDPAVSAYHSDPNNKWAQNPILWSQAVQIVQSNPAILAQPGAEQIKYAEGQMKMMYPAYFTEPTAKVDPTPEPAPKVDSGGMGGIFKTGTSAADLPSDALRAGKEFVSDGVFKSLEDYANSYFSDGNT